MIQQAAAWFQIPGNSEFIAAITGAVVGSLSAGGISWLLQLSAFKAERMKRQEEDDAHARAALLETLFGCLQAQSDLYKFAESAIEAKARQKTLVAPPVPGISTSWAALMPHATLPDPIEIPKAALAILVEKKEAELIMDILNVEAAHKQAIKLWRNYTNTRKRFGQIAPVTLTGAVPSTGFTQKEVEAHYPLLKEMSDLADGILEGAEAQHGSSRETLEKVVEAVEKYAGRKIDLGIPALAPTRT